MKKVILSIAIVMLILCGSLFTACSGEYEYSSNEYSYSVGSSSVPMAKTYDYSLSVDDDKLDEIKNEIVKKIGEFGQLVTIEQYVYEDSGHYEIEAKIVVDKVQEFTEYLEKNEETTITRKYVTSYDFSNANTSIPSKIVQLENNKKYYEGLLEEATAVNDKITINKEISAIVTEIDELNQELEMINERINYSKVEIYITNENYFDGSVVFGIIVCIIIFALPIVLIVVLIVVVSNKNRKIRELKSGVNNANTSGGNNENKDYYYRN